ncbi:MAG: shikimate dehydrogenase [Acidobacteriota bacterium]|nr:MAG: shikimate dehydrogenase [Acidobacteriota bacterium]
MAMAEEAAMVADAVELRLDYLSPEDISQALAELPAHLDAWKKPVILTFRPSEQGGMRILSLEERLEFWRGLPRAVAERIAFADLELDLVEALRGEAVIPWEKVICSRHDFERTPEDLPELIERMLKTPAGVIKIAAKCNLITDCVRIFEVIDRVGKHRQVIALGMGMAGLATRVLALSRGALLTFAALTRGAESAPGQPTVEDLRNLYRADRLDRETEIYGVIGNPVAHSLSPRMHNAALRSLGRNGVYLPMEVEDIDSFINRMVRPETRMIVWNLRGLSVTIPHKLAVMKHLDFIDPIAGRIGAVNTIAVRGDGLHGFNTDVTGAMRPLEDLIDVKGRKVAVLGAGGSARAICYGLSQRGADVTIHARNESKARALADEFGVRTAPLEGFKPEASIIINCTPIGMHGHSEGESPIPAADLGGVDLVYDLIYTPQRTKLIEQAESAGCRTLGGLAMLVSQAAEQFQIWTREIPPVGIMRESVESRK